MTLDSVMFASICTLAAPQLALCTYVVMSSSGLLTPTLQCLLAVAAAIAESEAFLLFSSVL